MRNRQKQRIMRKLREKGLSPRDETGMLDPTPYEAVKRIIEAEKAMIKKMSVEELEAYYRRVVANTAPNSTPEESERLLDAAREMVEAINSDRNSTDV